MQDKTEIIIGKPYNVRHGRQTVTPIRLVDNDKALFVTDDFSPTPFVIWEYNICDNKIDLYRGKYYCTLNDALDDISNVYLNICIYCKNCDEYKQERILLTRPVQDIAEEISDLLICDYCASKSVIYTASIEDDSTSYELPIYENT